MLMAKSRHKKPENVRRYFKPSPEAISELTSLLGPGRQPPLSTSPAAAKATAISRLEWRPMG